MMPLFLYGLEVRCSASQGKYLDRIDIFIRRPYRFGFTDKVILISEVIKNRGRDLLNRITSDTDHVLYHMFTRYPPRGGFLLAWLLALTKSSTSLVRLVVGLMYNYATASDANYFVNAKSHARKKLPLAGYRPVSSIG